MDDFLEYLGFERDDLDIFSEFISEHDEKFENLFNNQAESLKEQLHDTKNGSPS
jgi:hypothetical protein